jgi:hypothetical protein
VDDQLIYTENQCLVNSPWSSIADKVGNFAAFGSVFLYGSRTAGVRQRLAALQHRQTFQEIRKRQSTISDQYSSVGMLGTIGNTLVSVAEVAVDCRVVRFCSVSVQLAYEFLEELLRPLQEELPNLSPYQDRVLHITTAGQRSLDDPIVLLQGYDSKKLEAHTKRQENEANNSKTIKKRRLESDEESSDHDSSLKQM